MKNICFIQGSPFNFFKTVLSILDPNFGSLAEGHWFEMSSSECFLLGVYLGFECQCAFWSIINGDDYCKISNKINILLWLLPLTKGRYGLKAEAISPTNLIYYDCNVFFCAYQPKFARIGMQSVYRSNKLAWGEPCILYYLYCVFIPQDPLSFSNGFYDDDGTMSEMDTQATGFQRGGRVRASLPISRISINKSKEKPLGTFHETSYWSLHSFLYS